MNDGYKKYTPVSALRSPLVLFNSMYGDLKSSRALAWQLASRDIRAQYRQTFLGLVWILILPLANTATWMYVQSTGLIRTDLTEMPYGVFVFTGTMVWAIFMDAVNAPLSQTESAKPMLGKLKFPYESLIISGMYQTLINATIKLLILVVALSLLGVSPTLKLSLLPIAIILLTVVGTALGLLMTPIGILYKDIGKSLPLLMQFLMYLSPVVFSVPEAGWARTVMTSNPITPFIMTSRDLLVGSSSDHWLPLILVSLCAVFVLFFMWIVYRSAMPILIERIGS